MADPKPQARNLSVVSAETEDDASRGGKGGQSVSDYMEELIDRLNKNMGLPRDSKPHKPAEAVLQMAHHVEPAGAAGKDPDEEAVRHSRPSAERLYDLAAVRREAGGPGCGLAAALAERLSIAYWRLATTVIALAASFGLVQWALASRSKVGLYSGVAVLIVGLFWLYRYFKGVSQLAKASVKRDNPATSSHSTGSGSSA